MKQSIAAILALSLAAAPLAGIAQPRMISDLSEGALLGPVESTSALQHDFATHQTLIADAAQRLSLSATDYRAVRDAVRDGRVTYVTIPRHLDAMAGQYRGTAFAVRDITIPAGVHGWEVDLHHRDALVRVFVPNQCGNISYLRVERPNAVAAAPHVTKAPAVAVVPTPAPTPQATSAPTPDAAIAAAPLAAPAATPEPVTAPSPAPAVVPDGALVAAPAANHATALPWVLLGLAALAIAHPKVPTIDIPRPHCRPHG